MKNIGKFILLFFQLIASLNYLQNNFFKKLLKAQTLQELPTSPRVNNAALTINCRNALNSRYTGPLAFPCQNVPSQQSAIPCFYKTATGLPAHTLRSLHKCHFLSEVCTNYSI